MTPEGKKKLQSQIDLLIALKKNINMRFEQGIETPADLLSAAKVARSEILDFTAMNMLHSYKETNNQVGKQPESSLNKLKTFNVRYNTDYLSNAFIHAKPALSYSLKNVAGKPNS